MADIRLAKPAAGASESVQCAPDARFVFDFPTTDATLAREGDNLNISFQDGSQLRLEGFYQEYNGENLPSFNIDGTEVAAADFFQAMNEPDLMPAAGPGTGTVANGARFHEWGDSSLASGITHLNGLDWGFSRSFEWEDHPNAVGYNDDDGWRGAANTVPDLDVPAAPGRPYDPRNPGDDPNNPASPQNPGGYIPNTHGASIVVDEGALARGSGQHVLHGAHDFGSFVADVHAERGGSIVLTRDGASLTLAIPQDGATSIAIPAHTPFEVNGVAITITGAQSDGNGKWTVHYAYELTGRIDHDKSAQEDTVSYDGRGIAITVTDGSGDVTRGRLTVEVHDDVPLISAVQAGDVPVNNAVEFAFGADDDRGENGVNQNGSQQQVVVRVGGDETPLPWSNDTQSEQTDISRMEPGDVWKATVYVAGAAGEDGESVPIPVEIQVIARDGKYVFEYADKSSETAKPALDIKVEITDADGDTKDATLHLATPGLDVPPYTPPTDPENPEDPDVPGNKEEGSPFVPFTGKAQIVVDEGALTNKGNGAKEGGHDFHGKDGGGSFIAELPVEEGGKIVLTTDEGETISFTIDPNSAETPLNPDAGSAESFTVNGVKISDFTATRTGDGKWKVSYEYELQGNVVHAKEGGEPEGENLVDYSTDKVFFDADAIHITVTDGTGDTVTGQINIEVHDDVPVISAVQAGDVPVNNAVEFSFGADDARDENGVNLYGSQKVVVRVGEDETPLPWGPEGSLGSDISRMQDGQIWTTTVEVRDTDEDNHQTTTSVEIQVRYDAATGKYVFDYADKTTVTAKPALDLKVEITDADGDTKDATLLLATPGLDVPPYTPPTDPVNPEDPDVPGNKEEGSPFVPFTGKAQIVVDEGALTNKGNGAKEGGHDFHGKDGGGSFIAELPVEEGGKIVLTTDEGETISFTIDPNSAETPLNPDAGSAESFIVNGVKISDFTATRTGDGKWKVSYEYELQGNVVHAKEGGEPEGENLVDYSTDKVFFDADAIHITVTDGTGDTVTGQINIEVHDDVPVVTAPAAMSLTYNEGTKSEISSSDGVFGEYFGADGELAGGGKSYTLQVKEGHTHTNLQAKTAGGEEYKEVTLTAEGDGKTVTATFSDDDGTKKTAFTLTIDEDGKVSMKMEANIAIDHSKPGGGNQDVTLSGVQRVLTLTDGDGDARSANQDITITIKDTAAEFKDFTQNNEPDFDQEKFDTALSIDFTTASLGPEYTDGKENNYDIVNKSGRWYLAGHKTINIFGTHVAYNLDTDGNVILLEDQVADFASGGKGTMTSLELSLTKGKGLGIGKGDGAGKTSAGGDGSDFGVGTNVTSFDAPTRTPTDYHSEGVVIEPGNGTVNYGLTLTLSDFDDGERAILAFYLTPKGSNDNSIVKYVELPADIGYQSDGKYEIQIPDGFTKCIIAPIPKTDEVSGWNKTSSESDSHFKIAKIEFTQPVATRGGKVEWNANVDDVQELTWDWTEVKEHFGTSVTLHETLGAGSYAVNFPETLTGNTITVTLSGASSQTGRTLFTATLNPNGTWTIKQFYRFTLDNGKSLEECPIRFTITDGDGSITTEDYNVNLALASMNNRFDHVELGAFDADNWEGYANLDNVYDVLQGKGVNDLMYGRGGHDILFGDNIGGQEGFNSFATQVLGQSYTGGYIEYANPDAPGVAAGKTGPIGKDETLSKNESIFNQIYDRMDALIKAGNYTELNRLVKLAEGSEDHQGNDALFGGVGNDILFGGAGDDYLVGTGNVREANNVTPPPKYTDSNMLFGGNGRDILVYNPADKILDGGEGIDILLMGKKDWKDYNGDELGAVLNRLLLHKNKDMPIVRNVELLLVSKKTDFVEQLGITSQASLEAAYGIIISGNTVKLNEDMWDIGNLHSSDDDAYAYDRYVSKDGALQLDVLREGVRLEDYHGHLFDTIWRDTKPDPDPDNEACVMSLMDEDSAVPLAADAPEEGESVTRDAAFAAAPEQEEARADTAPEAAPADIVETPESFLARVESLGGKDEDIRFGTGGDDFLNSAEDSYVFADAGDDFILYDPTDYLIDGGTGIDFLLSESPDPDHSLAAMLDNWEQNGAEKGTPMVHDVEVMLKGVDTSLQNMTQLAEKYGFEVKHVEGRDILELDRNKWEVKPDQPKDGDTTTYVFNGGDGETVMLETSLQADDAATQASQNIVLTSNG